MTPPSTRATHTYQIHEQALERIKTLIEGLSKAAQRIGLSPFEVTIGKPKIVTQQAHSGGAPRHARFFPVTLSAEQPKIDGWVLLAKIDHTLAGQGGGNLIKRPLIATADRVVPDAYRTEPANCNHCNVERKRNETYLFQHDETGQITQIGSTCVADYLGHKDPHELLLFWDNMLALDQWAVEHAKAIDDNDSLDDKNGFHYYDMETILQATAAIVRTQGRYYSTQNPDPGRLTTRDYVEILLSRKRPGDNTANFSDTVTSTDKKTAKKALEWLRHLPDDGSDYEHNIKILAQNDLIEGKHMGLAVSALYAYQRAMNEKKRKKALLENNQHIGAASERLQAREVVFKGRPSYDTKWGTTYVVQLEDKQTGAQLVWKTTSPLPFLEGETYSIHATIKEHTTFRDIKQTVLTRVACPDLALIHDINNGKFTDADDWEKGVKRLQNTLKKTHNINVINEYHESAISVMTTLAAQSINNNESVDQWKPHLKALLLAGANPLRKNSQDADGRSAIDYALLYSDPESTDTALLVTLLEGAKAQGIELKNAQTVFSTDADGLYGPGGHYHNEPATQAILTVLANYGLAQPVAVKGDTENNGHSHLRSRMR